MSLPVHVRWRTYQFRCEFCGKEAKFVAEMVTFTGGEPENLREPRLFKCEHCQKGQTKPTIPKIEAAADAAK